jgi:hypothetical protein
MDPMTKSCALPLGQEGFDYLTQHLNERGLCAKVAAQNLSGGRLFAIVPEGLSLEEARNFDSWRETPLCHALSWLTEHLRECVAKTPSATILVQDVWAKASDRESLEGAHAQFTANDCLYYVLDTKRLDYPAVHAAVHAPLSFNIVGFVSDYALPREVLATHEATEAVIDGLAREVTEVFVDAYDREGFVVWQKA